MSFSLILVLLYLFVFGVYGVFFPFAPLILREQGLSDQQVHLALSTFGVAALISPLLISHFADRSVSMRKIMTTLLVCATILTPLWILLNSFTAASIFCMIYYASIIPVLTLLDAFTIDFVLRESANDKNAHSYQYYRIWGSVGFIIPSLVMIPLSSYYSINSLFLVLCSLIFLLVSVVLSFWLPHSQPSTRNASLPSKEALSASLKPPLRGIFAATTIAGLSLSIFYIVYPRFLQELGNSTQTIGLIINLGVVAEILLMPFSNDILRAFGARTLILAGLWSLPVRLFLVYLWPSTTMVVVTQILHAPLIIGLFISVPVFLGQHAHESYRYSLQGLNTALSLGIARIIGPLFSAFIIQMSLTNIFEALRLSLFFAACLGGIAFMVLFFSQQTEKSTV